MERLWLTGYRSYELSVFSDTEPKVEVIKYVLEKRLKNELENNDLKWLITGGNLGVEQWAIEVALELKKDYPIKVAMITPYAEFEHNWKEDKQVKFNQLRAKVDFYATVSNEPYKNFMQLKNYQTFMLGHTDYALLVYDTEHEGKPKYDYDVILKEAEHREYPVELIDFYELEEGGNDLAESRRGW